jgi:hypothetical protein
VIKKTRRSSRDAFGEVSLVGGDAVLEEARAASSKASLRRGSLPKRPPSKRLWSSGRRVRQRFAAAWRRDA